MIIEIGKNINIKSNYSGYERLLKCFYEIEKKQNDTTIIFNFNGIKTFDLNLFAVLSAKCEYYKSKNIKVLFRKIPKELARKLEEHKFPNSTNSYSKNNIGYKKFSASDNLIFDNYIEKHVLGYEKIPKMSKGLKIQIKNSLGEVFGNVDMHSGTKNVFCCGQIHPSKNRLDFTIVNLGKTIKQNVSDYQKNKGILITKPPIWWAIQSGNSTKTEKTGGFGLAILKEFICKNNGKIQIISDNEYLEISNGKTKCKYFRNNRFDGTIVNIEFNLNDKQAYILKSEIDLNDFL